ncbi:Xaa-Pro dipeptidyl-peptidase [Fructilactobacillus frigidiflavus]|uniref:Xaa-Pro dipeptidyl-peptidase n=1 Tax=Fructilactobacillus frigidiflavus TaxID=3242688 RepID=UPI003757C73F
MKINQFAQLHPNLATMKKELQRVGFATEDNDEKALFHSFLNQIQPTKLSSANLKTTLNQFLATPDERLGDFFASNTPLSAEVFYLVALQLLGFQADVDFDLKQPLVAMTNLNLFYHQTVNSTTSLIEAWYDLLNTHGKNDLTLLDRLAAQGYFTKPEFTLNHPLFFNGKAQATFLAQDFKYETVYVQTDFDSDFDGKNDLIKVEINRPKTDVQVPVAYTASPYDQGVNDHLGAQLTHNVQQDLTEKVAGKIELTQPKPLIQGTNSQINGSATQATETHQPKPGYTLNDYLLVRGFASVYAAGIGTIDSDGLQTCGDPQQTASTIAVIEWLHGDRVAFTNRTDGIQIKADWCNGNVAMTGRSYLGTLAIAAATTGVAGLKTIVAEAAISSWYDYYRENGLVVAPGGFQGEDADVLAGETFSRSLRPGDNLKIRPTFDRYLKQMAIAQDRVTGSYNQFWDDRNYRNQMQKIKADVMLVHGLNDWNVKLRNPYELWQGIQALPIQKKLILHQGQHVYINAFPSFDFSDIVNLWLSHELYELDNQAETILPNVIVQDNVQPDNWRSATNWPSQPATTQKIKFDREIFKNDVPQADFLKYSQHPQAWRQQLFSLTDQTLEANRLVATTTFADEITINGEVKVQLQVASDTNLGMLSAALLDYGDANRLNDNPTILARHGVPLGYRWYTDDLREFTLNKKATPFKLISEVHLNLQNRTSPAINEPIEPNQFYNVELKFQPTFYRLPKDRKLALVLYSTDYEMTNRNNQPITYRVNPEATLSIPFN